MDEDDALLDLQFADDTNENVESLTSTAAAPPPPAAESDVRAERELAFTEAMALLDEPADEKGDKDHPSSDDEVGEGEDELPAMYDGSGGDGYTDEQLRFIADKKEAKSLGRKVYKRWKKLRKAEKKHHGKEKKPKKEKKEKTKAPAKPRGKKRARDDDDDAAEFDPETDALRLADDDDDANEFAQAASQQRREAQYDRLSRNVNASKKKRVDPAVDKARKVEEASQLIKRMRRARLDDATALERGQPALHRVALLEEVQAQCQRRNMTEPLVGQGLLEELSYWLYDSSAKEPGPYALRTAALDILMQLPLEGDVKVKVNKRGEEDLTAFHGVTCEQLRETRVGSAINALRLHANELKPNRTKCVQLLQRFSRLFAGGGGSDDHHAADAAAQRPTWRYQNDPTIASPFEVIPTSSEVFIKRVMKPDPTDPTSYNNYLPWRTRAETIMNLSGNLGAQLRDNE